MTINYSWCYDILIIFHCRLRRYSDSGTSVENLRSLKSKQNVTMVIEETLEKTNEKYSTFSRTLQQTVYTNNLISSLVSSLTSVYLLMTRLLLSLYIVLFGSTHISLLWIELYTNLKCYDISLLFIIILTILLYFLRVNEWKCSCFVVAFPILKIKVPYSLEMCSHK